ncbi:GTP pyrophosphokinase [Desulfocicer vacuolatum DSM 3385]|uniref:GTP pyrophosphokinase n=1 Tax=Desulfocicer vacuolatum DSM 3385 TaxID=1121400 RepID=A0A1W2ALF6_9BACT|nr:HD domain-containing protein [Desulfocicer vacuolatum]SMC61281.1 GTP pyrophosphokinase [Desulfocicer vacuolatum DSM 3385]
MNDHQAVKRPYVVEELAKELPLDNFKNVIALCSRENPGKGKNLVLKALAFAHKHHAGQTRRSGEQYITHPIAAAEILAGDLGLSDPELIAAAILHDIVEDVPGLNLHDIQRLFGKNVAAFVDGCTKFKLSRMKASQSKDLTYQKMVLMASKHPEILLIKMADRMHNMETLGALQESRRQRIAQETMEVYAPLAAKLNLFTFKRRLYHLSLQQRFPKKSKRLMGMLNKLMESREVKEMKSGFEAVCAELPFPVTVKARLKTLWSLYSPAKKTLERENAENMVDFTIILHTDVIPECYRVLGMVNQLYPPVPKSIRDYIANPKVNGYQSLHVRISCKDRKYLVKIRNREMNQVAQRGVLLHWDDKEMFREYRQMISDALKNIGEFEGSPAGRKNLFGQLSQEQEIFVYTPRGDIEYLPQGSVVLDFAYKVHTSLGDRCKYAWVNNLRVSPGYQLSDGDMVKIVTDQKVLGVGPGFEQICKTPKARNAVNKYLQKRRRVHAIKIGWDFLLQEMNRHGISINLLYSPSMSNFLIYKNFDSLDDLFESVGQDIVQPREILWEMASILSQTGKRVMEKKGVRNFINISRVEPGVHKFSRCCKPLPGLENTVATLSKRGVSFHRDHCREYMASSSYSADKILDVYWDLASVWRNALKFKLFLKGKTVGECLKVMADIPHGVTLHQIEQTGNEGKGVTMLVTLIGFNASKTFFESFEQRDFYPVIEAYGRDSINF